LHYEKWFKFIDNFYNIKRINYLIFLNDVLNESDIEYQMNQTLRANNILINIIYLSKIYLALSKIFNIKKNNIIDIQIIIYI